MHQLRIVEALIISISLRLVEVWQKRWVKLHVLRSPGAVYRGYRDSKHKAAAYSTVAAVCRLQYAIRVADILNNRLILQGGNFLLGVIRSVRVDTVRASSRWYIVRDIVALWAVSRSSKRGLVRVQALDSRYVYGVIFAIRHLQDSLIIRAKLRAGFIRAVRGKRNRLTD